MVGGGVAKSMVGALEDAFKRNLPPNGLLEVKGGEAVSDIQAIKANSEGGRQGHAGKLDHYRLKLRNSRPRRQIFREADQIGAEPPPRLCEIDRTHPQRMPVEVVPVVERAASGGVEQHAEGRRLHRARPRVVRQVGEEPVEVVATQRIGTGSARANERLRYQNVPRHGVPRTLLLRHRD